MTLGAYLETHGLTQEAFGRRIGVTQGRVSQIIRDGTDSIETARRIFEETDGQVNLFGVAEVAK